MEGAIFRCVLLAGEGRDGALLRFAVRDGSHRAVRLRRAQVAAVDELGCDLREQREGEHVLLALGEVLVLLAVLGKLGLQKVGGAAGDDVLGA